MGKRNAIQIGLGAILIAGTILSGGALSPTLALYVKGAAASLIVGGITGALAATHHNRLQSTISPMSPLPVIYGEARTAVTWVEVRKHPSDKDIIYLVGAFALGPVADVSAIYFDDNVLANNPDTTGAQVNTNIVGKFDEHVKYAIHLGSHAQAVNAELTGQFPTAWPSTSKGAGVGYILLWLKYEEELFPAGFPNVTLKVQGRTLYDPRDSTTAYSTNPALCIRDYLVNPNYGCGLDASELDDESIEDAANYCDETVDTTAYNGPRFTANGILDTSQSRSQNLAALLTACRGEIVFQSGKLRLIVRQVETPSAFELTEHNITGEWELVRSGSSVPNSVTVAFVDPAMQDQVREVTWPEAGATNGFLEADNGIPQNVRIDLPFTQNAYMAKQIAMVALREARLDLTVSCTVHEEGLKLQAGEVVNVTHSTPGFTAKPFRVHGMSIRPNATVRPILREYDASAYELDEQDTEDVPPGTDLPDPFTCAPPTDVILTSDETTALPTQDGQYVPRILVAWTAADEPFLDYYEIRYRPTATPLAAWTPAPGARKDATAAYINGVTSGVEYDVEIRAVNTLGVPSDWVDAGSVTVGTNSRAQLLNVRTVVDTISERGEGWEWGESVDEIWIWDMLLDHEITEDEWPDPDVPAAPTEILTRDPIAPAMLDAADFSTFTMTQTPTRVAGAVTKGGVLLDQVADDSLAQNEFFRKVVPFTTDGQKVVQFVVAEADIPNGGNVQLFDVTAGVNRLSLTIAFLGSGALPTVATSGLPGAAVLSIDDIGDGAVRVTALGATTLLAANVNEFRVRPAPVGAIGDMYVGAMKAWDAAVMTGPEQRQYVTAVPAGREIRYVQIVAYSASGRAGDVLRIEIPGIGRYPKFIGPPLSEIIDTDLVILLSIADEVCRSQKVERIDGGGTWESERDGQSVRFKVPVPEDTAWLLRRTARSDAIANLDADTYETTEDFQLVNGNPGTPVWDEDESVVLAPAPGSSVATLKLKASSAPALSIARAYARYAFGDSRFGAFEEITSSLSPALTAPPTAVTSFTFDTGYPAMAKEIPLPPEVQIEVDIEIEDGSGNELGHLTVKTSWYRNVNI